MKHVTIKEIAQQLNLSVSTVSRALADDKNIRRETKEKILALAEMLGYKPNPVALNLKYGRTNTIGVIVPEMVTPFASSVIEGVQQVLYPQGAKVIIAQSNEDWEREKDNLLLMERFRVDGIIMALCHQDANVEECVRIRNGGTPIVFYDRIPSKLDVTKVVIDDYSKSFLLTEHLIRSGRKRILYLQGPSYIHNTNDRLFGFKDALDKFHIVHDPSLIVRTHVSIHDGRVAIEEILSKGITFDAVYAFTDTLAIGAMNVLTEKGFRIPEQVAVAGFSGTILSTIVNPHLTTVEQPLIRMGQTAAELLLEKIKDPSILPKTVVLDAEIKLRASTEGLV